jgi:hypothetical protein
MSDMDYSLSALSKRAQDARGRKLTDDEQGRVDELFQMINDAEAAVRKRLQKQLDRIEERMAAKDYAPKKRPEPDYKDPETLALQKKVEKAKRLWRKEVREFERANRTGSEKAWDAVKESPGFSKG